MNTCTPCMIHHTSLLPTKVLGNNLNKKTNGFTMIYMYKLQLSYWSIWEITSIINYCRVEYRS